MPHRRCSFAPPLKRCSHDGLRASATHRNFLVTRGWRALWASLVLLPLLLRCTRAFHPPLQQALPRFSSGVAEEMCAAAPRSFGTTRRRRAVKMQLSSGAGMPIPWDSPGGSAGQRMVSATAAAATAAAAAAAMRSQEGRAGFSLFRCAADDCEEEVVEGGKITLSSPSATQVMLLWNEPPSRVLVLVKPDDDLLPLAAQAIEFLQTELKCRVLVEPAAEAGIAASLRSHFGAIIAGPTEAAAAASAAIAALGTFGSAAAAAVHERPARVTLVSAPPSVAAASNMPAAAAGQGAGAAARRAVPAEAGPAAVGENIDLVLTLGGDGLLMHSSTLFKRSVPPHLCFNLGSMGFLTPLEYAGFKAELRRVVNGGINVSLRMRLSARIVRDGRSSVVFHALNEVVIDRGSSPYLSNIECYCDDQHLTSVQADGLIIATPTGSTAYSMSAGGSMVHPSVPAILFTPICPHSLSFRPIIFPDSIVLRCVVPDDARAEACVSFDGKLSQPLRRGDTLVIKSSPFPVPTICKEDSTADWFCSLDSALGFNLRMRQKALRPLAAAAAVAAAAAGGPGGNNGECAGASPTASEVPVGPTTIRNDDRYLEP